MNKVKYNPLSTKAIDYGMLTIISIIVIASIIDTSIIRTSPYTGVLRFTDMNITIFVVMVIIFATGQYIVILFVRNRTRTIRSSQLNLIYGFVLTTQSALTLILVLIALQMILSSSYNISFLKTAVWISCGTSALLLGLLAQKFIWWLRYNRSLVVVLYGVAMITLSINALFTILNVTDKLAIQQENIKPRSSAVSIVTDVDTFYNSIYVITSIISFILMWTASVLLLQNYSLRVGRIKYWILAILPLIYFLSQFQTIYLEIFAQFRLSDPILFGIISTLVFVSTKPIGGVLFGIVFWNVARKIGEVSTRNYMIISAYGIILLYTSSQIIGLILVAYPPFGLVTISFMGLASYLILIGIYSSAISVSRDSKLRQLVRKIAERESKFLDTIGTAQMEHEVITKVIPLAKQQELSVEKETGIQSPLTEQEIKLYLHEVLTELRKK